LRKRPPLHGLDDTLLEKRDEIRATLGRQWWQALLLSAGRLAFDYLCLLLALRATGSHPRPSLILVAYAAAGIVGMIPVTPGGLGLVEASLTGLLVLADVDSSQAVLATLTYRSPPTGCRYAPGRSPTACSGCGIPNGPARRPPTNPPGVSDARGRPGRGGRRGSGRRR
jgi:hypothetical protein